MKQVDDYEHIRKAYHIEGLSIREISRRYKHSRRVVRKALEHPIPEKYHLGQPKPSKVLGHIGSGFWIYWRRVKSCPASSAIPHTRFTRFWKPKATAVVKAMFTTSSAVPEFSWKRAKPTCRWNLTRARMPRSIGGKRS
jgi:hypothetical protein